jgi:uncharacterized protein YukJ
MTGIVTSTAEAAMSITGYGVLVGRVVDGKAEPGQQTPHYQVQVRAAAVDYRIAVNVRSAQNPPDLLYVADEMFTHPLLADLVGLADGFTAVPSQPGGLALDYIRGNLFDRAAMRPLPANTPGPDNDLSDRIEHFISRAEADPAARIYAFGQGWGPETSVPDKIFGFTPGNGVHDIHMNQGNSGRFVGDDGVWQDGGLLLHFPNQAQWVGIFLAFQSQAWHPTTPPGTPCQTSDNQDPTHCSGSSGPWSTRSARLRKRKPSPCSTPAPVTSTWAVGPCWTSSSNA